MHTMFADRWWILAVRTVRSTSSPESAAGETRSAGAGCWSTAWWGSPWVVTSIWPAAMALALLVLIGAWAMATGVAEVAAAIRLRKYIRGAV